MPHDVNCAGLISGNGGSTGQTISVGIKSLDFVHLVVSEHLLNSCHVFFSAPGNVDFIQIFRQAVEYSIFASPVVDRASSVAQVHFQSGEKMGVFNCQYCLKNKLSYKIPKTEPM